MSATRGEAGQIRSAGVATRRTLGQVREQELSLACQRLGVQYTVCLEVDQDVLIGEIIRSFRPRGSDYLSANPYCSIFPSVNLRTAVAKDKRNDKEENATALGGRIFDLDI